VDDQEQTRETQRHLEAAMGYLHLGLAEDANDAIERIPPAMKVSKTVLRLRVDIYLAAGAWEHMREVAAFLVRQWPNEPEHRISLAHATRQCRSIMEAEAVLLDGVELHRDEPIIHFNLACYAAQLGNLTAARVRLACAIALDPDVRLMALDDPDLDPLWENLGKANP
jgi:predicted Zn-dependent protease